MAYLYRLFVLFIALFLSLPLLAVPNDNEPGKAIPPKVRVDRPILPDVPAIAGMPIKLPVSSPLPWSRLLNPAGPDPIRFTMRASKDSVAMGEAFEITITAELLDITPQSMFFFEEQKSFSLKVLMPEGFVQTGGDYVENIQGKPTLNQSVNIKLSGHFQHSRNPVTCFQLVRRSASGRADELYTRVGSLCLLIRRSEIVNAQLRVASSQSLVGNMDITNCSYFKGWILDQHSPGVSQYVTIEIDGTRYGPILANEDWAAIRDGNFPGHPYIKYGFLWSPPASYNDGKIHNVKLLATASGEQLGHEFGYTANRFGIDSLKIEHNNPLVGESLKLNAFVKTGGEDLYFSWKGPNGFTSTRQNPSIPKAITANAGSYTVTAYTPSGCTSTAAASVSVNTSCKFEMVPGSMTLVNGVNQFEIRKVCSSQTSTVSSSNQSNCLPGLGVCSDGGFLYIGASGLPGSCYPDINASTPIYWYDISSGALQFMGTTPAGELRMLPVDRNYKLLFDCQPLTAIPANYASFDIYLYDCGSAPTLRLKPISCVGNNTQRSADTETVELVGGNYSSITLVFSQSTKDTVVTLPFLQKEFVINKPISYVYGTYEPPVPTNNVACNLSLSRHAINGTQLPTRLPLNLIVSQTSPACSSTTKGEIAITASGGSAPYQYSTDGGITYQASNSVKLSAGTYAIVVKDAGGCTTATTVTVQQSQAIKIKQGGSRPACGSYTTGGEM